MIRKIRDWGIGGLGDWGWVVPLGVALVLYWPTLELPLIYDTLLHIRIAGELDWVSVWLPTESFGFFRPMTFLPFLIIKAIFNTYSNWLLHGLNIVQHALNAALLSALLWRISRNHRQAVGAGLLFAVFPFSYQAVAVYGHNVHLTVAGLMLLGLHTHHTYQATQNRRWLMATWLLFVINLLTHESAILFGPILILFGVSKHKLAKLRSTFPFFLSALPFAFAGISYFIIYQFLPITRAPQVDSAEIGLQLKTLYLAQAASHPFARFGHLFTSLGATIIIVFAVSATLLLTIRSIRDDWQLLVFGWGWWLLASLLIAIALPTDYLLNGPRLLYLGSVGLAIVWAVLLVPTSRSRLQRDNQSSHVKYVTYGFLLFVLVVNWQFVRGRLADYATLTQGIETIREDAEGDGLLLVNLPQWIAPERNTYPVGAEFVQQLGDYLFVEEWTNANLGDNRPVQAVKVDELLNAPAYGYGVHAQGDLAEIGDWDVFVTSYEDEEPVMRNFGRIIPTSSADPIAIFETSYLLYSASATECDGSVILTTEWSSRPLVANPHLSIFAQLLNANGTLIAQNDRPLLGIRSDLLDLDAKQHISDQRQLLPENGTPTTVLFGIYNFVTGERMVLDALSIQPDDISDNGIIVPISSCTP